MKKLIILITIFALCLSSLTCFTSCQEKENEYTVTFYNNRGIYFFTNANGEQMIVKSQDNSVYKTVKFSGQFPSEPTPPTNDSYVFLGWYQSPECTDKFIFGYHEVKSDINLYAKWGVRR
mgnify:CR=1 FL=1